VHQKRFTGAQVIVLSRAFRPFLNAVFAAIFSLSAFIASVWTWRETETTGLFFLVAGIFFSLVSFDAAIPSKFRCSSQSFAYRNTFVWSSWDWEKIDRLELVESSWLGLPVSLAVLHMRDGRREELSDTVSLASHAWLTGGVGWALREIQRLADVRVVFTAAKDLSSSGKQPRRAK